MRPVIIDTDILSALMRRESSVVEASGKYIAHFGKFNISIITRYEILRGLKFKDAKKQIHIFDLFPSLRVKPYTINYCRVVTLQFCDVLCLKEFLCVRG